MGSHHHGLLHSLCGHGGLPSDSPSLVFPWPQPGGHRPLPGLPGAQDVVHGTWRHHAGGGSLFGHLPGAVVHGAAHHPRDGGSCRSVGAHRVGSTGSRHWLSGAGCGGVGGASGGTEEVCDLRDGHLAGNGPP